MLYIYMISKENTCHYCKLPYSLRSTTVLSTPKEIIISIVIDCIFRVSPKTQLQAYSLKRIIS